MGERISIAKAAKILGINRHELCDRLFNAGINGFEGAVDLDDVKTIEPRLHRDASKMSDRTRLIRQSARRRQGVKQPHKKALELQDELDKIHNKWLMERKKAQEFSAMFDVLIDELGHWQASDDPDRAKFAMEFSRWLCDQFD